MEKNVCIREEEVLLVNGTPITLEGEEGRAIKECLLKGTIPNQDLINHLLLKVARAQFYYMLSRSGSEDPSLASLPIIWPDPIFFPQLSRIRNGLLFYIKIKLIEPKCTVVVACRNTDTKSCKLKARDNTIYV